MSDQSCLSELAYETRNLGRASFAVSEAFIQSPDRDVLLRELRAKQVQHGKIFVQARVAKQYLDSVRVLESCGLYFIESVVVPHAVFAKNELLQDFLRDRASHLPRRYAAEDVTVSALCNPEGNTLQHIKEIAAASFIDDRFHLDRHCAPEVAGRRYSYWMTDLARDAAANFYMLDYRGQTIAFLAAKAENLLIGGFLPQYASSGLGEFLWLAAMEHMQAGGFTHATTLVSVNNTPSLNLHSRLGYRFKNPSVTLHYWSERQA